MNLYKHQREGVGFLVKKPSAGLLWEMGLGKSCTALLAAKQLFDAGKIDRVLVLAPAAVRFAWTEELTKLEMADEKFNLVVYNAKRQDFTCISPTKSRLPVLLISYSLLPQERHVKALTEWCFNGSAALVCDESSFLKNRTAKQTKGAAKIAEACCYRWLLTGTPICNSPLDLYGQALVMSNGDGPLKGFKNFYHFRSRYATTQPMRFGGGRVFQQVTGYQNLEELQRKFAPYVSRVEKKDALDLPPKSYSVREVQLDESTWKIYQELKREAMLALSGSEEATPEPNAAVRLLRLCQLTSGHIGTPMIDETKTGYMDTSAVKDVSSEKLDYLADSILDGELSNERALIVWCRWRRERERLAEKLRKTHEFVVLEIFGGQSELQRTTAIGTFGTTTARCVLLAQPHAGGFGLTLTAAHTAVYLSNDFSYSTRIQSEDRCHRIGQVNPVMYIDVIATGPNGERTVDHHVVEALRAKEDIAKWTVAAWKKVLA